MFAYFSFLLECVVAGAAITILTDIRVQLLLPSKWTDEQEFSRPSVPDETVEASTLVE